jgi:hypothetical protein
MSEESSTGDQQEGPFYVKCTCGWVKEVEERYLADGDAREHLAKGHFFDAYDDGKDVRAMVLDDCGRELDRFHATFKPEHVEGVPPVLGFVAREKCDACGHVFTPSRATCPECGEVRSEAQA